MSSSGHSDAPGPAAEAAQPSAATGPDAKADSSLQVPRRRIIVASLIGTTIEFYDFYIYATAAVSIFPLLFFVSDDPGAALLASMATFGAAFVARPLGSVIFGHYGDKIGRKATLVGALLTMGIATFIIGLLPTIHQIGLWAPIMLTIMRFCQGLGLGGEWSGAALLASETAKPGKRAAAAMWPQLGAPFGFILANGLFLILATAFSYNSAEIAGLPLDEALQDPFLVWGWRLPFLLSVLMVAVGLYVRLRIEETPVFARAVANDERVKTPVGEVFAKNWWEIILGTFIMLATYGLFYLMTTWVLSFAIGSPDAGGLGYDYQSFLVLQIIAIVFFAIFVPVAGSLADKFGRRPFLIVVTAAIMVFGLTFGVWLDPDSIGTGEGLNTTQMVLFLCVGMTLMGLTFGPMSAYLPELFPTNTRYTGSGVAYNFSSILGAALTPFVAAWLVQNFGVATVGWYLAGLGVLTLVSLILSPETNHKSLYTAGTE
ncbi:MAG TPA: MHS family MFS transporter [Candidatus Nesterenkonia stercoripullorum]|uniref:MHS family MFS transporter n=1 Tax=Candidatus Nesterenkonia stercoripullorum TaxID=2838701 RepID=A0A9D1UV60_9MICC|nr:MHS family MFS transporter [Candidatus Nesterenkonia stercoripullorum]